MTLSEYFDLGKMTRADFAAAMGVDPVSVYRWERGLRLPVRHFARISEVTQGSVTANDFVRHQEAAQ